MRQSLLTSFLLMMGATAPLTAQVHPNQFVELTAGFASSIGGDYEERTLYAFHLMGAQRMRVGTHYSTFAGVSAGMTVRGNSNLTCRSVPQGGCVPLMPTLRYVSAVTGAEARKGIGSISVVVGPGVSRVIASSVNLPRPSNMTAFHLDGALEAEVRVFKHAGIVLSRRAFVLPNLLGARVNVVSTNIGIRSQ